MSGDLAESLGGVVGEYLGTVYGHHILAFLIPIMVCGLFIWAVEKFVRPMPEPDYRRPLIALIGAQLLLVLGGNIVLLGFADGFLATSPAIVILGGAAAWLFTRPGVGPLLLIGACELYGLVNLIWALTQFSLEAVVIANILGTMILVVGALLWVVIGLKYRHASRASSA